MKKLIIIISIIIIAAAAVFIVYSRNGKQEDCLWHKAQAVIEDMSEYVEATGAVVPENRINITPASSGRIEKLMVEEGAHVKAGQVLAEMSSSDRVAILDAARSLSPKEYKHYQNSYKPIKITAPAKGTIILKDAVNGETVNSAKVIYALSDTLIVEGSIDESDIGKIKPGQAALINLDAYPKIIAEGRVMRIADEGTISNNVVQYKVKIRLLSPPKCFKSQMTANIKIRLSEARNFLLVPVSAVMINPQSGNTAVVKELDAHGLPVYKDVEIGSTTEEGVEIVSGLKEGDEVLCKQLRYIPQNNIKDESSSPLLPDRRAFKKKKSGKK